VALGGSFQCLNEKLIVDQAGRFSDQIRNDLEPQDRQGAAATSAARRQGDRTRNIAKTIGPLMAAQDQKAQVPIGSPATLALGGGEAASVSVMSARDRTT